MRTTSNPYRGFRFPAEIINQAVWLYHCFSLSVRKVELILAARGIVVSMRSSARGACASGGTTPTTSSEGGHKRETSGSWMVGGFKFMTSAPAILCGIEMVHLMREGQAKYACSQQLSLAEQFHLLGA